MLFRVRLLIVQLKILPKECLKYWTSMHQINKALIKTLLYSNLFHFPLTAEEIWKFLLSEKEYPYREIEKYLKLEKNNIEEKNGLYFLKGYQAIVSLRKNRQEIGNKKIQKAHKIIQLLSLIPTILLIGISGSVAVKNADQGDDIDLFI